MTINETHTFFELQCASKTISRETFCSLKVFLNHSLHYTSNISVQYLNKKKSWGIRKPPFSFFNIKYWDILFIVPFILLNQFCESICNWNQVLFCWSNCNGNQVHFWQRNCNSNQLLFCWDNCNGNQVVFQPSNGNCI